MKRLPLRTCGAMALACALVPHTADACSLVPVWGIRDTSRIAFIGTPYADTVRAGPGTMNPVLEPGHFGRGQAREIFGQRVRVDQLGAQARRALPAGVREVVLVPWDYAGSCRPVPWNGSARWLADAQSGLFRARLRARADWADGLPTFDIVGTHMQPYPARVDTVSAVSHGVDPLRPRLTAEALLRFYDMVPPPNSVPDSIAALAFARQIRADSTLHGRYPAAEFYADARGEIDRARQNGLRIPVAGTFRIEAVMDSGPPRTFFLRTNARITTLQLSMRGEPDTSLVPPVPEGYSVLASAAPTLDRLAPSCNRGPGGVFGYMDLAWHPPVPEDGTGQWIAGLDGRFFERMLSPEELEALRQYRITASRAHRDSIQARNDSLAARGETPEPSPYLFVPYRPLRVTQDDSGPMRIDGTMTLSGLGAIPVRAERISHDVMPCGY